MKTKEETEKALDAVRRNYLVPEINEHQKACLSGMLTTFKWILEKTSGESHPIERMLNKEPVDAGKDPTDALHKMGFGLSKEERVAIRRQISVAFVAGEENKVLATLDGFLEYIKKAPSDDREYGDAALMKTAVERNTKAVRSVILQTIAFFGS
jgi:hypothetical protein